MERAVSRLAGYQKVPLGFQLTCDFIDENSRPGLPASLLSGGNEMPPFMDVGCAPVSKKLIRSLLQKEHERAGRDPLQIPVSDIAATKKDL